LKKRSYYKRGQATKERDEKEGGNDKLGVSESSIKSLKLLKKSKKKPRISSRRRT